ncbi:alpha/beta hydrolase [Rurimicrobium arvi]|uniref:Alpha/beta hydrolase n=1 Tax=Rurimicrobium arvi TaxID=2049916 RepID=A0ABP8MSM3_9BACT
MKVTLLLIWLSVTSLHLHAQEIPYGNNPAAGKYIVLNGIRHYYETYGAGPALLLIHGNGTATKGWKTQIPYFAQKYTVYAVDCRGRGKSDMGTDTLTYVQQAEDMAAFIRVMHLDSVNIIGKSDGAIVALLMGIYYPSHIKKIVAFSANLWPDSTALYDSVIHKIHLDRLAAEEKIRQKDTSDNWEMVRQRMRLMEFQPHITAADLGRIAVPVLVISGDRDVIREEHTLFIYKSIRYADLCFLPGEKHEVPKTNPALFNLLTDKFLSEPFRDTSMRY